MPKPKDTAERLLVSYRPTVETHETVREIAHRQRRSFQSILDEALQNWLATHANEQKAA